MTATERLLFFIRNNGNPNVAYVGKEIYEQGVTESHANYIHVGKEKSNSIKLMNTIFVLDESLNPNQVIIKE